MERPNNRSARAAVPSSVRDTGVPKPFRALATPDISSISDGFFPRSKVRSTKALSLSGGLW